jgi:hypothetical protein
MENLLGVAYCKYSRQLIVYYDVCEGFGVWNFPFNDAINC